jgi:hypothetical protein
MRTGDRVRLSELAIRNGVGSCGNASSRLGVLTRYGNGKLPKVLWDGTKTQHILHPDYIEPAPVERFDDGTREGAQERKS